MHWVTYEKDVFNRLYRTVLGLYAIPLPLLSPSPSLPPPPTSVEGLFEILDQIGKALGDLHPLIQQVLHALQERQETHQTEKDFYVKGEVSLTKLSLLFLTTM